MPQLNRDKETLYGPGRLSLWFLVTSGALFACIVWMLWADYDRPWKTTQKEFYRRQAQILDIKAKIARDEALGDAKESEKTRAELADIAKKLAVARQALEAPAVRTEIAALEANLREQDAQLLEADNKIKSYKGKYSELRYKYEMELEARQKGHGNEAYIKDLESSIDKVASDQVTWERKRRTPESERLKAKDRLDAIRGDVKALETKRDELLKAVNDFQTARDASVATTEKNQWRNLPVIDFLAPSIGVDKVVLPYIHDDYNFATTPKVDMCTTCHAGIDRPVMAESEVRDVLAKHLRRALGEKAWDKLTDPSESGTILTTKPDADGNDQPDWLGRMREGAFKPWISSASASLTDLFPRARLDAALGQDGAAKVVADASLLDPFRVEEVQWAHPHLGQLFGLRPNQHPKDSVGCTVCHHGRGWSTDFRTASHTPRLSPIEAEREEKAIESKLLAKEGEVHTPGMQKPHDPAGILAEEARVAALEAEIRDLKARLSIAREQQRWGKEYGWREPEYIDFPMLPLRYVEGQCLKCHLPALVYPAVSERLDRPVPAKPSDAAGKPVVNRPAPKPVDGPASLVDGMWHPERLEHGVRTMKEWGCLGCHVIKSFGVTPGWPPASRALEADLANKRAEFDATPAESRGSERAVALAQSLTEIGARLAGLRVASDELSSPPPGSLTWADSGTPKVGPDLTHIGDKTTAEWAKRWIYEPTSYRIDTRMPAFYKHRLHDDQYRPIADASGKPAEDWVMIERTRRDEDQADVEVLALVEFLFSGQQYRPLAGGYPKVPEGGDAKKGEAFFYGQNCFGCHVGPGKSDESGRLVPDDGARFSGRPDLPPGPRLVGIGSKMKPEWLYEWLREPHRYWPTTRMPNNRIRDEMAADNKTVVRSEALVRADVVAYLMSSKVPEFDAQQPADARWTGEHDHILNDMWLEFYGKGSTVAQDQEVFPAGAQATADVAEKYAEERNRKQKLLEVGRKLVGARGCFGCHNVSGYEKDQPIGKELSAEGSQDIHKFDFGILSHEEVPHTRWDWLDHKLDQPRLYDKGRFKPRWTDKLRMPRFNFRTDDRDAVVTTVLGLVKEPLMPQALATLSPQAARLAAGRAVVERYNCNQCHTIEGRIGILTRAGIAENKELGMLPPNLYGEGNRVNPDWLFRFVKNPGFRTDPADLRPLVVQRMPWFHLSDDEARSLVDYFLTLADRPGGLSSDKDSLPLDSTPYAEPVTITLKDPKGKAPDRTLTVRNEIEEAKALFDAVNCVKCHLRKGTPGSDPNEGAIAPPFVLAHDRLRRDWMSALLHDPQTQIPGTKMTNFWGLLRRPKGGQWRTLDHPEFLLSTRGKPGAGGDEVAEAQMNALVRYLLFHFEEPKAETPAPPSPPAPPDSGGSGPPK